MENHIKIKFLNNPNEKGRMEQRIQAISKDLILMHWDFSLYPYETPITVKANERPGYGFEWSDGNENYERTFELESAISLTPIYTAKTNTPYVVKHYKQKITLDGYEIEDTY